MAKRMLIKNDLHFETLPKETKSAFDFMALEEWQGSDDFNFYLAGGTALALQTGNRKSFDLDFFTPNKNFNNIELIEKIRRKEKVDVDVSKDNTVYVSLLGAKMSFISYPFFVPKCEFLKYGSIKILDKKDVAVMKILAISQRGKKRDFFDLYWYVKNLESLEEVIKRLPDQYPSVAHDYNHILKSLMYFADAEEDPDPELNFKATWKEVKSFFEKNVPIVAKSLINLK